MDSSIADTTFQGLDFNEMNHYPIYRQSTVVTGVNDATAPQHLIKQVFDNVQIEEVCTAFNGLNQSYPDVDDVPVDFGYNGLKPSQACGVNIPVSTSTSQDLLPELKMPILLTQVTEPPLCDVVTSCNKLPLPCVSVEQIATPSNSMEIATGSFKINPDKENVKITPNQPELLDRNEPRVNIYDLRNISNDDEQPKTVKNPRGRPKRTTSPNPPKPTVRANAKLINPYRRFKTGSQAKVEIDDNKLVNFSYRRKNNCRLGYTTQEVSIQFCDDTVEVPSMSTSNKIKRQPGVSKKRGTSAKPALGRKSRKSAVVKGKKAAYAQKRNTVHSEAVRDVTSNIRAKRVSVAESNQVVTIETPILAQVARIDTHSKCVDSVEVEMRDGQKLFHETQISSQSDFSSVRSFNTTREAMYNFDSSSDLSIHRGEYLQPMLKPRHRSHKTPQINSNVYILPVQRSNKRVITTKSKKNKDILKAPIEDFQQQSPLTAKRTTLLNSPVDILRRANCSVPNTSIPSFFNLGTSTVSNVSQNSVNPETVSRPSSAFVAESPSPPRPPSPFDEVLSLSLYSLKPKAAEIKPHNKSPKSILKKTPTISCQLQQNISIVKRNAILEDLAQIPHKRSCNDASLTPTNSHATMNLLNSNWILRNYMENIENNHQDSMEDLERTIDSMDNASPIRANLACEPMLWLSDSDLNLDDSSSAIEMDKHSNTGVSNGTSVLLPLPRQINISNVIKDQPCKLTANSSCGLRRVSFAMVGSAHSSVESDEPTTGE